MPTFGFNPSGKLPVFVGIDDTLIISSRSLSRRTLSMQEKKNGFPE